MNVLLIGSGGREHALAWSMKKSPVLDNLFISPGNPGTAQCGENVALDIMDNEAVIHFCTTKAIDLVVVGPEAPLVNGLHDAIADDARSRDTIVIGPKEAGAMLEGSKDFSKQFMQRNGVPTAAHQTFDASTLAEGQDFLATLSPPFVLKCDGLAAGKGVLIIDELSTAQKELANILQDGSFGAAGAKVVVEEFLHGVELSAFILTDGKDYLLLPTAKDYKRIGEGDTGLNTGGMGALSPAPAADDAFMQKVKSQVIDRTLSGLQKENIAYHGFLFIGLMKVGDEPYVIEYNVRMGDPETEAVLPRIDSDLLGHFAAVGNGTLSEEEMKISNQCATTIMMVSGGYPQAYEKGAEIKGLGDVGADGMVFHAGTKEADGKIVTNGGRVLTITAMDASLGSALQKSYENISRVYFDKCYYRKDIGYELSEGPLR